ncbi:Aste57867_14960 [Aphanomyces stellatus]|uniref:Aste57867_14960 protein n=1 Tax=Aphanomyces stellatus TaxID=120398 RepID=A0A485L213_9STRA|nr:hypothetical protein As57867_014904 [Aphanomyces stellatus]VFT91774.1 Aste57867_14960 [Aphanomyces stellatus]
MGDCLFVALTSPLRCSTYLLLWFHVLNLLISSWDFAVVLILVILGLALLPLCCLGLVFLQLLLYALDAFAHIDARLYNFSTSRHDQITLRLNPHVRPAALSGKFLSHNLSTFSCDSFAAAIYFLFVKPAVASIFSGGTLSLALLGVATLTRPSSGGIPIGLALIYLSFMVSYAAAAAVRWFTRLFLVKCYITVGQTLYSTLPPPSPDVYAVPIDPQAQYVAFLDVPAARTPYDPTTKTIGEV